MELVEVLKCDSRPVGYAVKWVFGDMEWDVDLVCQTLVQTA